MPNAASTEELRLSASPVEFRCWRSRWCVHQSMQLRKCDGRPGQGGRLLALAGEFRGLKKEIGDGFQADDAPLSRCFSVLRPWLQ